MRGPSTFKSLGDAVSDWMKNLVRRCVMGSAVNAEVIGHCVLLAQECFRAENIPACAALLSCIKTACEIFPSICSFTETFSTLTELFSECRTESDLKKELDESGVVTALSAILSASAESGKVGWFEC